jgi:hypothetical protein
MDPTVQGIFFLIAVVLFVLAAFTYIVPAVKVNLIALGLAFATFVFMWNAFAAS